MHHERRHAFQALENIAEMAEDAAQSIFNGTSPKFPRRDLTKRGRDVLRRAHTVANKVEELMMASMTAMDAAHLATVLSRCTEDLSAADEN